MDTQINITWTEVQSIEYKESSPSYLIINCDNAAGASNLVLLNYIDGRVIHVAKKGYAGTLRLTVFSQTTPLYTPIMYRPKLVNGNEIIDFVKDGMYASFDMYMVSGVIDIRNYTEYNADNSGENTFLTNVRVNCITFLPHNVGMCTPAPNQIALHTGGAARLVVENDRTTFNNRIAVGASGQSSNNVGVSFSGRIDTGFFSTNTNNIECAAEGHLVFGCRHDQFAVHKPLRMSGGPPGTPIGEMYVDGAGAGTVLRYGTNSNINIASDSINITTPVLNCGYVLAQLLQSSELYTNRIRLNNVFLNGWNSRYHLNSTTPTVLLLTQAGINYTIVFPQDSNIPNGTMYILLKGFGGNSEITFERWNTTLRFNLDVSSDGHIRNVLDNNEGMCIFYKVDLWNWYVTVVNRN